MTTIIMTFSITILIMMTLSITTLDSKDMKQNSKKATFIMTLMLNVAMSS
jgi:hypothetical protein